LFGEPETLRTAPPSRHAKRFLSLANDSGLAPGRVYEVGGASGEMLNQFRRLGWDVRGCDLSQSAAEQAKSVFGIEVDLGGEETTLPLQKNLDLVLACHVLEHLYDPLAALVRIHAALRPGGYLLLEVPCATAPDSLLPGWFAFEHLHYYRTEILERMLNQAGLEVMEMRIAMKAQHYPVVAVAARKAAGQIAANIDADPEKSLAMARRYVDRESKLWADTERRLSDIRGPVFLYGAGIHTAQLLDRTNLAEHTDIIAVADRDPKRWGQTLAGKPVISPAELFAHTQPTPVVISSYVIEKQIIETLLKGGIAASRIKPLYSDIPG
jgi:SAM-dependent methyltransferase